MSKRTSLFRDELGPASTVENRWIPGCPHPIRQIVLPRIRSMEPGPT